MRLFVLWDTPNIPGVTNDFMPMAESIHWNIPPADKAGYVNMSEMKKEKPSLGRWNAL